MNKNYFAYLIKSKKHLSIFLLVVNLLPTAAFLMLDRDTNSAASISISMAIMIGITFIESVILPFIYYNFLQSKRALDTYYNLPIKKSHIIITNYVYMILQVIIFSFIGIVIPVIFNIGSIHLIALIISLLLNTLFNMVLSLFILAIIYKTHSIIDSLIISISYGIFIPALITAVLSIFANNYIFALQNVFGDFQYYILLPLTYFYPLVMSLEAVVATYDVSFSFDIYLMIIEVVVIGLASFISIKRDIKLRKAEVSETVSSRFFAYPFVIGVITLCLLLIVFFTNMTTYLTIFFIILILILYLIMTFVYRRKIKINKKDLLIFASAIIIAFVSISVAINTDGFGLNRTYRNVNEMKNVSLYVSIQNTYQVDGDDLIDCYTPRMLNISDKKDLETIIAYEDSLYDEFKKELNGVSINEDSLYFLARIHLYYSDENDNLYQLYDYYSVSNREDLDYLVNLIDVFSDYDITYQYYDGLKEEYVARDISIEEMYSIISEKIV